MYVCVIRHVIPHAFLTLDRGSFRMSLASMLMLAMSFTTTPTRRPSLFSRMCFSSVVLPEPNMCRVLRGFLFSDRRHMRYL